MHVGSSRLLDDLVDRNMAHRRPTSGRFLIAICSIIYYVALWLQILQNGAISVKIGDDKLVERLHYSQLRHAISSTEIKSGG